MPRIATGGKLLVGQERTWSPKISVIVPAYNAESTVAGCLAALQKQTYPRSEYEILLIDDGSTDRTAQLAIDLRVRVLSQPRAGPAAARNRGIEQARGEIVLFTDADCEPTETWIAQMVAPFENPLVMGVKGTYRTHQRELIARLVQIEFEIRYQRMTVPERIDFVDTYAAGYRRALLLKSGSFDPAFPVPSAEDVDLSFRLARQGHWLVFVPGAQVWHRHPAQLGAYLKRKVRFGYWRALLYLRYPDKIQGDAHTDPALKVQFLLLAVSGLIALGALLWPPLLWGSGAAVLLFLLTTLPFVRWAWSRDRQVAVCWPGVNLLRVWLQGLGLAFGLLHCLFSAGSSPPSDSGQDDP